ncbi:hypothetical protein [Aestuariicoccus sp. MJ-SS9]|uniref:hypothetical protein n=1 Tax=Aestuariicoccus sp. MJ-SS9 TaxID=3079855 RepID=UPI00290D4D69|nr:hypothetical protein [Aestuariicoccus sp. MJ-SS9]MDU8913276.1 hypothetical protein [Aestuariicoccus sp. MJ-SS9]
MNTSPLSRILLVNSSSSKAADLENTIDKKPGFIITKISPSEIAEEPSAGTADLILVNIDHLGEDELLIFPEIRARAPETPLILLSEDLPPESMRQLFKFNVQDWLQKPFSDQEILDSIRSAVRVTRVTTNKVHAVISCVGGAGATTVAINMADIAANKLSRKSPDVALIDLDFSTGNCGYVLNMVSTFNLGTVASAPRRIDAEFISVIQQKHEGKFFLYSFKRPEVNTEINGYELVLRLLDAVTAEHGTTFLDIPYYATEWRDDVLSAVNSCTLVTELNLPAIKHTLDLIEHLRSLRGANFPIQVFFNKHKSSLFGSRVPKRKLKELFPDTPFGYLPLDESLIGEAVDRGVLPSSISGRAKFLKVLTKYMKSADMMGQVEK